MIQMRADFSSKTMGIIWRWNASLKSTRNSLFSKKYPIHVKKKNEGNRKSFSAKPKMSRPAFHKMLKEVFQMKGNGTRWKLRYKRKDEEHWWWWNVSKCKKAILFLFLLFLKDKWLLQGKSLALYHGVCNVQKWKKKKKENGARDG